MWPEEDFGRSVGTQSWLGSPSSPCDAVLDRRHPHVRLRDRTATAQPDALGSGIDTAEPADAGE